MIAPTLLVAYVDPDCLRQKGLGAPLFSLTGEIIRVEY